MAGAEYGVTSFAHVRFASMSEPESSVESMQEMIAIAATGASVHVCHIASTGLGKVPIMLEMFDAARAMGLDISTEVPLYGIVELHRSRHSRSRLARAAWTRLRRLPAQRMETAFASMRNKGQIRVGADADLTDCDPETVIDNATFDEPALPSTGNP
jgi:dihydroorotase-like cyclic amidohydrolase